MKIANFVAAMQRVGEPISWETPATKDGCAVIRSFMSSDRYCIDFAEDFRAEGWEQFDTDQDASYYGVWVNRTKFLTLSYAEGDWTLVVCKDRDSYNREVARMIEFHGEGFIAKGIDLDPPQATVTVYRQDRQAFFA